MSIGSGPTSITSGLVLNYDMHNIQKSFKGAPSTNLLAYSQLFSNWTGAGTVTLEYGSIAPDNSLTATKITNLATMNIFKSYAATISVVYCFSIYVKKFSSATVSVESNTAAVGSMTFNFDTLAIGVSGAYTAPTISSVGNDWYRISANITASSTANLNVYLYGNSYGTGGTSYIWGAQLEVGTYATPYIKTTVAAISRSTAQSIIDLTRLNTISAPSLTYSSNGSFTFNGANSITIPHNPSAFTFSNEITIELVLQPLENDAARRNPFTKAYGGHASMTHEPAGTITYYYGTSGIDASPWSQLSSNATVAQNEIAVMCITRNVSNVIWYKNGVQTVSAANAYGVLPADTNPIVIGSGYAGAYMGNIFSVKVYNRALTAIEVSQNFNALRSRFGI
jgi:hypothetical protein